MYVRSWKKGNSTYASVVKSERQDGKVVQKTVAYLGVVNPQSIPYLKAAYSRVSEMPILVYPDGKKYDPRNNS